LVCGAFENEGGNDDYGDDDDSSSSSSSSNEEGGQQRAFTCAYTARQVITQVIALTLSSKRVGLISATGAEAGAAVAPIAAEIGHIAAVVGLRRDIVGDGSQDGEKEYIGNCTHS
jgi:hypothetical protein